MNNPRDLRIALRQADWEALLPRLGHYAEMRLRRVGWASGRDTEPSAASVRDVVNSAIERCLDREQPLPEDPRVDLEMLVRGRIDNVIFSTKRTDKRRGTTVTVDAALESCGDTPSVEEAVAETERTAICAAIEECARGETDLEGYYLAVVDGNTKREDIAQALGWPVEDVSAARNKLQRRLIARFPATFSDIKKRRAS